MSRLCKHCGTDIADRHPIAMQCFSCYGNWGKKTGAAKAHAVVAAAIKSGRLPSASAQSCADCGETASDYDHRDYSKPLEVQAVCRSCNKLRGPAIRAEVVPLKPKKPRRMTPKQQAIEMLGGNQTAAAKALGITYQAVRKWPDNLTPDIENRLIGMLVRGRRKVPAWLKSTKPTKEAAHG